MMILGFLVIAILIYLVLFNTSRFSQYPHSQNLLENTFDILKRRYASGEISTEEFMRMKEEL